MTSPYVRSNPRLRLDAAALELCEQRGQDPLEAITDPQNPLQQITRREAAKRELESFLQMASVLQRYGL